MLHNRNFLSYILQLHTKSNGNQNNKIKSSGKEGFCSIKNVNVESENIMKTDLQSNIGIAEMSLVQVVKILDKQLNWQYS
jgi:hypothetical protein